MALNMKLSIKTEIPVLISHKEEIVAEIRIDSPEYKEAFIGRIKEVSGCDDKTAENEYLGQLDAFEFGDYSDPVDDADECMSYWSE